MNSQRTDPRSTGGSLLGWLVRANTQVSQWAASMSWWRLILLFLIILIAAEIVGSMLNLKHDRVRAKDKEVVVSIGGPDGIRVIEGKNGRVVIPPRRGASAAAGDDNDSDTDPDSIAAEIRKELEQDKDLRE